MASTHVKYLLAGAGLASSSAAKAIRDIDPRGELMLVGQERMQPYHRPPLSKEYLREHKDRSSLFVQPPQWYAQQHVQLRTGVRASNVDVARRMVALENGEEISFDKLLIATGMSPIHLRIGGAELANVHYIRTAEDSDRLHHAAELARKDGLAHDRGRGRATVVGGGVLGVEMAASLTQLGMAVDLFMSKAQPWDKFAGEQTGKFLIRFLEQRGVRVHAATPLRQFEGDGRVQRAVSDAGSIACDFVAVAVGAAVNRELLRGTPINHEKAILTDVHLRTNIEGIYAAGDCAAVFDPLFGKHRVLDHWDNAQVTGTLAGMNMAGKEVAYDVLNYFFSDVFDLSMQCWGEARLVDRRLIRGTIHPERGDFVEIGLAADGRIVQVLTLNHPGDDDALKQLILRRIDASGHEELLKDPAFSLQSLFNQ